MLRVLPSTRGEDRGSVDILGGILLGSSTALLLLGISQAQSVGFAAPTSWPLISTAPILAALFIRRIRTAAEPFVQPALFANRSFTASTLTVLLAMLVNLTALVFVPIMIIEENGLAPGAAGLIMVPGGIALAVLSPVSGRLSTRTGPLPLVLGGLALIGGSMLFLVFAAGAAPIMIAAAIVGLDAGFAFVITNVTAIAAESQPPRLAGTGLGIFQGAQFLGAGAGPALAGVFLDSRQAGGSPALNPFYRFGAAGYSDLFLGLTVIIVLTIIIANRIARSPAR